MRLGFIPLAGFAILLVAFLFGITFILDNGSLPVGPEVNQITINQIDLSDAGTPAATNVTDVNFSDGNFEVTESPDGRGNVALADNVDINGNLTVGGSTITGTFMEGEEFRFANVFMSCNTSVDHLVQTAAGEVAYCARGDNTFFVDTNANGTNCVRFIGQSSNLLARFCEGNVIENNGIIRNLSQSISCVSDGTAAPGTLSLLPTHSAILLTVLDPNGCNVTMSETGMATMNTVFIVNISTNTASFADVAGVQEMPLTVVSGQWDTLTFLYVQDRWVFTGGVDN